MHRFLGIALMIGAIGAGCSDKREQTPPPPEETAAPADQAAALAERAREAYGARQFETAGELYENAVGVLAQVLRSPIEPFDPRVLDWRCQAALSYWLAGQPGKASELLAPAGLSPDELRGGGAHLAALAQAMGSYRAAGGAMDDPDRMVAVLSMAPALQVWGVASRMAKRPAAGEMSPGSPAGLVVQTQWTHLARMPELLAGWTALDRGRFAAGDLQVVALLALRPDERLAGADLPPMQLIGAMTPADRERLGLVYPAGGELIVQPPPGQGTAAELFGLRDWLAWMGEHELLWNAPSPPRSWRLLVGVRQGYRTLDYWQVSPAGSATSGPAGAAKAGEPFRVVFDRPAEPAASRLLAGLNLLLAARPGGETVLETRGQADAVVRSFERLGSTGAVRAESRDGRWWVVPAARAGSADGQRIPLVAGWLAYRAWYEPPPDQPAAPVASPEEEPDEDASDNPAEP